MRIIIAGAGAVGMHLAKMLSQENHDIIVIDPNEDRLREVGSSVDVGTLSGSAGSVEKLMDAGIKKTDLFIAVTYSESINILSAVLAKRLGAQKTIARIDNPEYLQEDHRVHFVDLGIDYMIYPEMIAAKEVTGLLQQTSSSNMIDFSDGKLVLLTLKLDEDSPVINKPLSDTVEDIDENEYRAVAITRDGKTIIPRGDDTFAAHDLIYVITNKSNTEHLAQFTGKKGFEVRNIMILGGSRIGLRAAKALGNQHSVKLIEANREKSYRLSNILNNALVINGDGRNMDLLIEEGLNKMDVFVAVTGDSETNILSCVLAKNLGVKKTIAEVENIDYISLAEKMGIDAIINKKLITASRIFRFTKSEELSSMKYLSGTDAEVMEFVAKPGSKITRGSLSQVDFPTDSIVGGVIRGDKSFIANGYTSIKPYDKVVVFALPTAFNKVGKFFS
ncbi:MAG: Trk system potassium transporter TrkA [Bacteroidetes bacterium]|jgi:trk system potassium uptake protein TrkA|nr:Trk system potassium transporter TrkA [Bacteroidota bacterium]